MLAALGLSSSRLGPRRTEVKYTVTRYTIVTTNAAHSVAFDAAMTWRTRSVHRVASRSMTLDRPPRQPGRPPGRVFRAPVRSTGTHGGHLACAPGKMGQRRLPPLPVLLGTDRNTFSHVLVLGPSRSTAVRARTRTPRRGEWRGVSVSPHWHSETEWGATGDEELAGARLTLG
jgi:hypothetical protein